MPPARSLRRSLGRALLVLVALVALLAGAIAGYAELRWNRTFVRPPVPPSIVASKDPAVIARGRYIAYGPGHCASCHVSPADADRLHAGEQPPLAGGQSLTVPPGTFHTPNLTPDVETGIGRRSDEDLARQIRYAVRADGRAAVPFMSFQGLSDEDLVAVISFLRAQPAVRNPVPDHELNLLGRFVMAALIAPVGPAEPPPARNPAPGTAEHGAYMANVVAACASCHTRRSLVDGSYRGPRFAGGNVMPVGDGLELVTPNLTPDPQTGRITKWTEDQFVARFRQGKLIPQSEMPWAFLGHMSDEDLRAIYRYLHSLAPVRNDTGPSVRRAG